jgi:hypothetical protein
MTTLFGHLLMEKLHEFTIHPTAIPRPFMVSQRLAILASTVCLDSLSTVVWGGSWTFSARHKLGFKQSLNE